MFIIMIFASNIKIGISRVFFHVACPVGYFGENCSKPCPPQLYGSGCMQICNCPHCHPVHGCNERNGKKEKNPLDLDCLKS